jgi:hypothetical protein
MSLPKNQAWFAAKRYGYGWGLPLRWQGWVVVLGYIAAVVAASIALAADHLVTFIACSVLMSAVLVGIATGRVKPRSGVGEIKWASARKDV